MKRSILVQLLLLLASLWLLAACTPQPAAKPAPAGTPITHNPLERANAGNNADSPNRSCKTNADCVVKNVGNCCGYYPACVNTTAKVNPQAVANACRKSGTASVCGFPAISSCECVQGTCQAQSARAVQAQ